MEWLTESIGALGDISISFWGVLRFCLILGSAYALSWGLRRGLRFLGNRWQLFHVWLSIPDNYLHYALLLIGGLLGLSSLGLSLANFTLLSGVLAIGIGFGMRTLVSNFVAGLVLLIEQPLKFGDFIELPGGGWGRVTAIHLSKTQITTFDSEDVLIPNAELINAPIINRTYEDPTRRVHIPFRAPYRTDPQMVVNAGVEAAKAVKYTLQKRKKHQPQVWIANWGENAFDYELIVWVKSNIPLSNIYLQALKDALQKHQIEISFPQAELILDDEERK